MKRINRPSKDDIKLGWNVPYDFLYDISEKCRYINDRYISLEQVEAVILVLIEADYLAFEKE